MEGTGDEVGLAAESGPDPAANPRGVRLRVQVDFQRGIDRGHRRLAGDHARVVDRFGAQYA
jgi:hypothetical protein